MRLQADAGSAVPSPQYSLYTKQKKELEQNAHAFTQSRRVSTPVPKQRIRGNRIYLRRRLWYTRAVPSRVCSGCEPFAGARMTAGLSDLAMHLVEQARLSDAIHFAHSAVALLGRQLCVGGGGADRGDDRDVRTRYGRRCTRKWTRRRARTKRDKEDKVENKNTYVGVGADGLRHAGRQGVGRERVAPSQAELRRMSVFEIEATFCVEM